MTMVRIESLLLAGILCISVLSRLNTARALVKDSTDVGRVLGGGLSCAGKLTYFETEVLVTFEGFDGDPRDITRINWEGLEQTFLSSYNDLVSELCDKDFTRVVDATINVNTDGEILIKRSGCEYALRYTVQAVCRGCNPKTATLFSPPGKGGSYYRQLILSNGVPASDGLVMQNVLHQRRMKSDNYGKVSKGSKGSKAGGDDDDYGGPGKGKGGRRGGDDDDDDDNTGNSPCDCKSTRPQYRTPTEEEFRVAYDAAIRSFRKPASRRHGGVAVDYVVKVNEVEDVECSGVEEEFTAIVSIEFFGDMQAITDEERAVLEENFIWVYNGLQADRCDSPFFRMAQLSEIILVSDPDEPNVFLYVFFVTGTCRGEGCSEGLTLFAEDAIVRKLAYHLGYSGSTDACQCPLYTMDFGAPSTAEFEVRYFQSIQCEREKGRLVNIAASGEVVELGLDFTPFPTDFPIAAPSFGPPVTLPPLTFPPSMESETFAPSAAPSIDGAPFNLETFSPSASPFLDTIAPSMIPSTEPSLSQSISQEPSLRDDSQTPSILPSLSPTDGDSSLPPSIAPFASVAPSDSDASQPPSVSTAPSRSDISQPPSLSNAPSDSDASQPPSVSDAPSISAAPSDLDASLPPTISNAPSGSEASQPPSVSDAPSLSVPPSRLPVLDAPSVSFSPSTSDDSLRPSVLDAPSVSNAPSDGDVSQAPSVSNAPSTSEAPSVSTSPNEDNGGGDGDGDGSQPPTNGGGDGDGDGSQPPTLLDAPSTSVQPSQLPTELVARQ